MKCAHCGETVRSTDPCPVCGKATAAPAQEPMRVLHPSDGFCPKCGHGRDKSSVSSIDHGAGLKSCQMCGTQWVEQQEAPSALTLTDEDWQDIADLSDAIIWSRIRQAVDDKIAEKLAAAQQPVKPPSILFEGWRVYHALSSKAQTRTSVENVSDVLDAVVRLIRAQQPGGRG